MSTVSAAPPLGDNHHNGAGMAGNKSFMSYRTGKGVPGYTGYIPGTENFPVPAKTAGASRAELDRGEAAPHSDGGTITKAASSFKADFSLTPAEFAEATMPNPLYDIRKQRPAGDPPFIHHPPNEQQQKFMASSTFAQTFSAANLEPQSYPADVTPTGILRPPLSQHATSASPFYSTEYMQKAEEGHLLNASKQILPAGPEPKERVTPQIRGVIIHQPPLTTSYRETFGKFGADPRSKTPGHSSEINFTASTVENFQGTTKASFHPPGYSGFIPQACRNPVAQSQALCGDTRKSTKDFVQQTLFQYPHNIPGYAGYRPITAINDVGSVRDATLTTSGRELAYSASSFEPGELGLSLQSRARHAPQPTVFGKKAALQDDAFTHESLTGALSDNGRHDAEMYYMKTRPYDGRSVAIIKQGHWNQLIV